MQPPSISLAKTVSSAKTLPLSHGLQATEPPSRVGNVFFCKPACKRITINVGGRKFIVKEGLFDKFPNSVLCSYTIGMFYDKEKKEHFFDRDPDSFKYIIEYCRTGRLHVSDEECFNGLLDELEFFNIPTKDIYGDTCCEDEYGCNLEQLIEKHNAKEQNQLLCSTTDSLDGKRSCRGNVWTFMSHEDSSLRASLYCCLVHFLTVLSAVIIAVETVTCEVNKKCGDVYQNYFFIAEIICVSVFTADYLIKLWSTPERFKFLRSFLNVIDVLALVPFYLTLILRYLFDIHKDYSFMAILRLFRVFRIIKLAKRSERIKAIIGSLSSSDGSSFQVVFVLFGMLMLLTMFSTVIFFVEQTSTETPFSSIPETLWYTAVTITSLG